MTMVDEHTSAFLSRSETRDRIDAVLDEQGAVLEARLCGRKPGDVDRDRWVDDPSNEAGAKAMMAVAAGQGGRL